MASRLLVITALRSELSPDRLPAGIDVAYCEVGKVNAALSTVRAIEAHKPDLIVNYGTVGKINPSLSGLVSIGKVIQRDMIAEPLAPRGTTPFSDRPSQFSSEGGAFICATGDSFVMTRDPWLIDQGVDVVDMELFAVAAAAHDFGIPWHAYKYITDSADEASAADWGEKVSHGQTHFVSILEGLKGG